MAIKERYERHKNKHLIFFDNFITIVFLEMLEIKEKHSAESKKKLNETVNKSLN